MSADDTGPEPHAAPTGFEATILPLVENSIYSGAVEIAPGVWVYQITKNGLALQLTLQGTKYYKDDDLNDKSLLPTARRETAGLRCGLFAFRDHRDIPSAPAN